MRAPTRTTPRVGHQRREGIVRDLRSRGRDSRDQGRLTDVRKTDQRDVGLQFQLEVEPVLLPDLALLGEGGRAAVFERNRALPWPPSPPSAASQRSPGPFRSTSSSPSTAVDHGADGHDDDVPCPAIRAGAWTCRVGRRSRGERGDHESPGARPDCGPRRANVATLAAVAAVGTALATWASRRN